MSTPKRAPLYLIRALAVRGAVLTGDIHRCLTGLLGLDDGGLGGPGGDEVELEALEDDLKFLAGDELDVHPLDIVGGEQVGTRRSPGIDLEAEGTQIAEIHLLTGFQTFQHALGGGDEHGRNVGLVHCAFTRYQGR